MKRLLSREIPMLLLLAALASAVAIGQAPSGTKPAVLGTGVFTVFVENMDRSLAFYHDAFGMTVPALPATGERAYNQANPQLFAMIQEPYEAAGVIPGAAADMRLLITVNDMDATKRAYSDVLGFTFEDETAISRDAAMRALTGLDTAKIRLSRAKAPGSTLFIEFVEFKGVDRTLLHMKIQDRGAARLQLRVDNVDSMVAAMKPAGFTVMSVGGVAVPIPPNLKGALVADPNNFFLTPYAPCEGCAPTIGGPAR